MSSIQTKPTDPMAPSITFPFLFILLLAPSLVLRAHGSAPTLGFDLHHCFSDKVRDWTQAWSPEDAANWPTKGTPEYYTALVARDQALLRGRGLQATTRTGNLTFADGNMTVRVPSLGSLHYAVVGLGTPNVTFLMALDTGSNLMWVPCDCENCSPHSNATLKAFNSTASSTSERVPCSSSLCDRSNECSSPNDTCPYIVKYLDGSSTSGVLLEDVMYLTTDDRERKPVEARVTFGCGQEQGNTTILPGLLGLGLRSVSVPTTLAQGGLTSNSFSVCSSPDGSGRISFGDKGMPNQHITPVNSTLGIYGVTVTDILMDGSSLNTGFDAYLDTGASYTILEDPMYSAFAKKYESLVQGQKLQVENVPFEYCYVYGSNTSALPMVSMVMKGGSLFNLYSPEVYVFERITELPVGFCLAIIESSGINIIGQNFLTGQKLVFDRERDVIGWTQFDCYNDVALEALPPASAPTQVMVPATHTSVAGSAEEDHRSSAPRLLNRPLILSVVLSQLFSFLLFTF